MSRRYIRYIVLIIVLATGAILCALRWDAWFSNPEPMTWQGDVHDVHFATYLTSDAMAISDDTARVLVLGDVHNSLSEEHYLLLSERHPDVICLAQVGDWLDRGTDYHAQWLAHQMDSTRLRSLPVINCPGNHEYHKALCPFVEPTWLDMFPQPQNGPYGFLGTSYFVDFPAFRFIVLDTQGLILLHHYTRTLTWLRATMAEAGDKQIVVMMHHPVLSSVSDRFNVSVWATFRYQLSKADLVLSGHDHNYVRHLPFVGLSSVIDRERPVAHPERWQACYTSPVYGVLEAYKQGEQPVLMMRVYDLISGQVVDSFSVAPCLPAPQQ